MVLDFLVTPAQNCKIYITFSHLRTITQEGNIETRQMTPFVYLLFDFCFSHSSL